MIVDELTLLITHELGFAPTAEQAKAMAVFAEFLTDRSGRAVMIMHGSAGTGKTSLAAAMVKTLVKLKLKVSLMAPTGRAAKVFSLSAGQPALTVHRKIYRQKAFTGDMMGFSLNVNKHTDTLFIIDESSMTANGGQDGMARFGSGRLLDDVVEYVYSGRGCRLLLLGDKAQLPPVGEEESLALSPSYMAGYGLKVYESGLNEVLRQAQDSGILYNATAIRGMITHDELTHLPLIRLRGFADVVSVPGSELVEQLAGSYSQVGVDETIVITRSNKRATIYNKGIRAMVLGCEEELSSGDLLMVVRNNYFWANDEENGLAFLANGDHAEVLKVRNVRQLYGFRFADLWLRFPDYDGFELQATAVLDSLGTDSTSLTREQGERLFNSVLEDYADMTRKSDRLNAVKNDPYYNALQVKYAYAVTCHKAQGGQWAHVYLDQGYMTDEMLTPDYIHWLYTAFTRATEKLFLVNWPSKQTEA